MAFLNLLALYVRLNAVRVEHQKKLIIKRSLAEILAVCSKELLHGVKRRYNGYKNRTHYPDA